MTLTEAARLAMGLTRDTSTQTFAALNGWEFAASREYLLIAEMFDLLHRVHAAAPDRVQPYPRPWPDPEKRQFGKGTALPLDELRRTLDAHRAAIEAENAA